jgi:hypothetical protein
MRILTLAETAERIIRGMESQHCIKEHIDVFNRLHRSDLFEQEPKLTGHSALDAYFAGLAEHAATILDVDPPAWVEAPTRFLSRPFFMGGPGMRTVALVETPSAFRRRNVFSGQTFAR